MNWWLSKTAPTVYMYDQNGVYTHDAPADPSPLEPDVWLLPAQATFTAVPEFGERQRAVWQGEEWIVEDIPKPEPSEQRQLAYQTEQIIAWQGEMITVDAAGLLWLHYAAEDSDKAAALTALIVAAKAEIRREYPDA